MAEKFLLSTLLLIFACCFMVSCSSGMSGEGISGAACVFMKWRFSIIPHIYRPTKISVGKTSQKNTKTGSLGIVT